jgi:hypothetical protein
VVTMIRTSGNKHKGVRRIALSSGAVAAFACLACHVSAQVLSPGSAAMQGSFSLNRFDDANGVQEDFIFGQSIKGPYTLGWKGLRAGSESVYRDGVPLAAGKDYTLDANTGSITFAQPIAPQQLVKVTYQTVPGLALQNNPLVMIPLSWKLYQSGKSALTFNTLFKGSSGAGDTSNNELLSSLSFAGSTRMLSSSTLTSGLYLDLKGGRWQDRSALSFGEKTHFTLADLAINFSRAGAQFKPNAGAPPVTGAAAGKEIAEILANFRPLSYATISTSFKQTMDLLDPTSPSNPLSITRVGGLSLAMKLPDKTQISAGRTETTTRAGNQNGTQTVTDTLKVDRDINAKTHIAANYDANSTSSTDAAGQMVSGSGTYSQKAGLSVTSKAIDQVSLTGSVSTALSSGSATDTGALSLEATPFHKDKKLAKLKVKAGVQSQVTATGAASTASALVEVPALTRYQASLSGGLNYSTSPTKSLTVGVLDVNTKPLKFLELSGGTRLRDGMLANSAPDPSVLNTYNMKFALGPSKLLKLTGSFSSNPEAADGTVRHSLAQMIGLESDFTLLKLSGQVGQEQLYDTPQLSNNMKFGLDFRLSKYDLLSTAWEGHSLLTTSLLETSIYRLGYTRKLGSALDLSLSGSMTQQAVNGVFNPASQELKAEAKIGIHF